jgi:hypothetical protein
LPCRESIKLAVGGKKFPRKKKGQAAGSLANKIRLCEIRAYSLVEFLAAIMVVIVIVVPIAMATCPRVFQVATAALRLAAVFTMLAFRIVQLALGIADLLYALSVVVMIAVKRPCWNRSAQER